VFRGPNELFQENSWIQVMLGQGIVPEQYHPVAGVMSDAELAAFLNDFKSSVERTVAQLPQHQAYIEQYCPAGASGAGPAAQGATVRR
jgi:tryptophan 7-halogenase